MQIIATLWWPSPDLIGFASVAATLTVSILVFLTGRMSFLSVENRRLLTLLAPTFLLAYSAMSEGSPVFYAWYHGRAFPNASDFVAGYIYLAFGFGYSLHLVGQGDVTCYRVGAVFGFICGTFIATEATILSLDLHRPFRGLEVDWMPLIVAAGVFTVLWIAFVIFRRRQEQKRIVQTGWSAGAYLVKGQIVIHSMSRTCSGIGWCNQPVFVLLEDAPDDLVGRRLREALNASTWESQEDDSQDKNHPILRKTGAATWRDLEQQSKFVSIDTDRQQVKVLPSRPVTKTERGRGFTHLPEIQIVVEWECSNTDLGSALRKGLQASPDKSAN